MPKLKYVVLAGFSPAPVLFPLTIPHDLVGRLGHARSAGFCELSFAGNGPSVRCYGRSDSLDLDSDPASDEAAIRRRFFEET